MLAICNLTQEIYLFLTFFFFLLLEACFDSASEVQIYIHIYFFFWSLTFSTGDLSFILIKGYHSTSEGGGLQHRSDGTLDDYLQYQKDCLGVYQH